MKKPLSAFLFLVVIASGIISEAMILISEEKISCHFIGQESKKVPFEKEGKNVDKKLIVSIGAIGVDCLLKSFFIHPGTDTILKLTEPHFSVQTPPPEFG